MLEPVNGREPVSASQSDRQNAYWSASGPADSPQCCSGAI